jgi:hypothetical protein
MSKTIRYQVYVIENAAGKFYIGLREIFKSGCGSIIRVSHNGREIAARGRWSGRVSDYRLRKPANWKSV